MGSLVREYPKPVWSGQALSNVSVVSITFNVAPTVNFSVQAAWTGNLVGSFKLQGSNDPINVGWTDYPGAVSVNGPGSAMWNVQNIGYGFMRLIYVPISGSGTVNAASWFKNSL